MKTRRKQGTRMDGDGHDVIGSPISELIAHMACTIVFVDITIKIDIAC